MANVGTSIGGLFSSIGSGIAGIGKGLLSGIEQAIPIVSPVAEAGLGVFGAVQSLNRPQSPVRTTGAAAMPGGAPMAMISTTGVGAGPTGAGLSALVPSLRGVGQALVPGGSPGPVGMISPVPTRGGMRLPRIVNVPNPNNENLIETYVRAPRPRYRVSISGPRRRCRGGR